MQQSLNLRYQGFNAFYQDNYAFESTLIYNAPPPPPPDIRIYDFQMYMNIRNLAEYKTFD